MKVAVLGASGLVGRSLCELLNKKEIDWVGTYNSNPIENAVRLDIHKKEDIDRFLCEKKITHCINCVAQRNVDVCEKEWEETYRINCLSASLFAAACQEQNIYFVHISTDYVFDGTQGPYLPSSPRTPIQAYGKSKYMAEEQIEQQNSSACIVRVPVLYTQRYKYLNETAITMIGKKVMNRAKKQIEDNYYIRRPVFIDDFVIFLFDCLLTRKKGIFHFFNTKDKVTKYTMAVEIGKYLSFNTTHISPQVGNTHCAGRPYDTFLYDTQYNRSDFPETSIQEGIAQCFQKYKHPPLHKNDRPMESILYLIDLDGTLVDTDKYHYVAYSKAFERIGKSFCPWDVYITLPSVEVYCRDVLGDEYFSMKQFKQSYLQNHSSIQWMPGAEDFLQWLLKTSQNFVIVTNTSQETVTFFQSQLPLLQEVHQWIVREDVDHPKPHKQPYELAIQRYSKQEFYILGIENTLSGVLSLRQVTPLIYIVGQLDSMPKLLQEEDAYFIHTLHDIFT